MRKVLLLVGLLAVSACSVDHVVVAELRDQRETGGDAGAAGAAAELEGGSRASGVGGASGAANSGGSGLDAGGVAAAGGAAAGGTASGGVGGNVFIISGGGTTTDFGPSDAGAAGATAHLVCSCLGQAPARVCGGDGVTYEASCDDGSCLPRDIACWHACPCGDNESATGADLFAPECAEGRCADGITCLQYSGTMGDVQTTCGSTI